MQSRILAVAIIGIIGTPFVFAACGSSKGGSASSSENTFVLSEFTIVPPNNTLHPGRVTISANNVGGEMHELVIVRAASVDTLPKKSDGSIDESKIAVTDKVAEIADVASSSHKSKTFNLQAGTYIAFCNIVDAMMGSSTSMMNGTSDMAHDSATGSGMGHVHFAEGMHVTFTVS